MHKIFTYFQIFFYIMSSSYINFFPLSCPYFPFLAFCLFFSFFVTVATFLFLFIFLFSCLSYVCQHLSLYLSLFYGQFILFFSLFLDSSCLDRCQLPFFQYLLPRTSSNHVSQNRKKTFKNCPWKQSNEHTNRQIQKQTVDKYTN